MYPGPRYMSVLENGTGTGSTFTNKVLASYYNKISVAQY